MDCEIDSPNFGYRRVLISHYKMEIQCFETGAGYFTWSGQPVFLPIFNMAVNANNFSFWSLSALLLRYLIKKHYGMSIWNQPSEMKYPKYSKMTKFLFYRYSPETQWEGEPSELFCGESPFSQLSMNLNINRSAFRICPPLNLVFKIGHLLGWQILKSSLPIITMEAGQVVS